MKRILITLGMLLPILAVAQKSKFVLTGTIASDTVATGKIYFGYNDHGNEMRDSAIVKNNAYRFEGNITDGAVVVNLFWREIVKGVSGNKAPFKGFAKFYVGPGDVKVAHGKNFGAFKVTGSKVQDDDLLLNKQLAAKKGEETNIRAAYIESHPDSWLSYIVLEKMVKSKEVSIEKGDELYSKLSPSLKKHSQVPVIKSLLTAYKAAVVGRQAIDFTEKDVNGKEISLSSFKGRYVLIDFWASWCHPCREENPVMVKAYDKYKSKGFEILGVSLDGETGRKAWTDAIAHDGTTWTHVSNLKGFGDEVATKYGITSIPRNFLIDPSGKIVATDLRGPELEEKLAEILK